ncbi:MAG: sigma-70 family RNA polymerase sigma factor [Myxococcota bacterium]
MSADLELQAARVARGDRAAFRVIVEHTQVPLHRLATRLVGNPAEAEDVLQEAYVKAFRALTADRFAGDAALSTWLYRIVTNAALDHLRRRRPQEKGAAEPPEPGFDGTISAEARLALRELDLWLKDLTPDQRAVVILKAVEGMTTPEVAEVLDCSEGAVEQRLVRARAALRRRRDAPREL